MNENKIQKNRIQHIKMQKFDIRNHAANKRNHAANKGSYAVKKGSLTIEAVLSISIFMILAITLFGTLLSVYLDEKLQWSSMHTLDELTIYAMPFMGHDRFVQTEVNLAALSSIANSTLITNVKRDTGHLVSIEPKSRMSFSEFGVGEYTIHYHFNFLTLNQNQELILPMNAAAMSDGIDFKEDTVFITNYGEKYHLEGCLHLKKSKFGISLEDALKKGYEPCKNCHGESTFNKTK